MRRLRTYWPAVAIPAALAGAFAGKYYLERPVADRESRPPFSQIETGLYLGGRGAAPPPGTQAVLCLAQQRDSYTAEVYRWQPIADGTPMPSLDWLRQQVLFIDAQRRAGRQIYVHCDAGVSRSAMVVAAYLMWCHHWTRDIALAFINARRAVHPNRVFMKLLGDWGDALKVSTVQSGAAAGS